MSEALVSLREFNERLRLEKEIVQTRETAIRRALVLQAKEYQRRLLELNHAHDIAIENWRTALPREVFDGHLTEFRAWRDSINTGNATLTQLPTALTSLNKRLETCEDALQQALGALVLIRYMGFAGVVALIVTFLRMAGVIP